MCNVYTGIIYSAFIPQVGLATFRGPILFPAFYSSEGTQGSQGILQRSLLLFTLSSKGRSFHSSVKRSVRNFKVRYYYTISRIVPFPLDSFFVSKQENNQLLQINALFLANSELLARVERPPKFSNQCISVILRPPASNTKESPQCSSVPGKQRAKHSRRFA